MVPKRKACDCNDVHHTGHDYIHYKHVGDQCIHPDGHIHKIGENLMTVENAIMRLNDLIM